MSADPSAVVSAYWRFHELCQGDREQRLAAEAGVDSWAWEAVEEAMQESDDQVLHLLDALLRAPEADPCYLGAGPIEELLYAHGPRWQEEIAQRCRTLAIWRNALTCVSLNDSERGKVPLLAGFLPRGNEAGAERTPAKRPKKVSRARGQRGGRQGHAWRGVTAQRDRLAACEQASAPRTLGTTELRGTALHSWVSARHLHGQLGAQPAR